MRWQTFFLIGVLFFICTCFVRASESQDYQRDSGTYRDSYAEFLIKNGSYTQLHTFAAEEELIQSARNMLLARADVWISYWQFMWAKMSGLNDFPIEDKQAWRQKFITEVDWLKTHKEAVRDAKTRETLMKEATALNDRNDSISALAFAANADISTGSLIQAAQRLQNFNQELLGRVTTQQLTQEEKDIKTRGLEVQADRVEKVLTELKKIRADFKDSATYASMQSFTKITQETSPLYAELSQQYQIAEELAEGVEW